MPETQWMTLLETADMMKRLPIQVTRMCEDGKLEYYMEDGRYFVSRESIDLFMRTVTGGQAKQNPDTNGTPRRQYGRAPEDIEHSTETAAESAIINGLDATNAAGDDITVDIAAEAIGQVDGTDRDPAAAEATADAPADPAEALGHVDDAMMAREHEEPAGTDVDGAETPVYGDANAAPGDTGTETPVNGEGAGKASVEKPLREHTDPVPSSQDGEPASSAMDPDDHVAKAAEIIAELRAALARHAMQQKAFCDEIAGLADTLESTLSRGGDKTSELTREISSLLARYTRR